MTTHKIIDPMKVAKLSEAENTKLYQATDLLCSGTSYESFPPELHAFAFLTMRRLGANVKCHADMHLTAIQLRHNRLLIDRLRAYGV